MGVKSELKQARARMQGGEPAEALSMIQGILNSGSPELEDPQILYAVLVSSGMAGFAAEDYETAETSFRRAASTNRGAPQAWKGLIDCLERAGKVEALQEALLPAVEIAESKQNFIRSRTLRLRMAQILEEQGRVDEALEALGRHLDNPAAVASDTPADVLPVLLHAAVLEEALESAAVSRRVQKRLGKDAGIGGATSVQVSGTIKGRSREELTVEYRAKAICKDDEEQGMVGRRLTEGLRGLEAISALSSGEAPPKHLRPELIASFCRTFLRRAVQRVESWPGGAGRWRKVLDACAVLEAAIAPLGPGADHGWIATAALVASVYETSDSTEMKNMAMDGADDGSRPWLMAEASMHLAWLEFAAGDVMMANKLLERAEAVRARDGLQDVCSSSLLSGPGSNWRELSLRCLVNEGMAAEGIERDPAVELQQLDAASAALDESRRSRGPPCVERDPSGSISLTRASLLLRLGHVGDARAILEMISAKASQVTSLEATDGGDETEGTEKKMSSIPAEARLRRLHCEALCVASDVDLAEGMREDAQDKLRRVLEIDGRFVSALSRLGWILLGFEGAGEETLPSLGRKRETGARETGGAELATPLLEKACQEEPQSSKHALRLARCYWEHGGDYLSNRNFCFSQLLRAAKLNPSSCQVFEWLGHWYQRVGGDEERARGCFMRAVKLNPTIRGAGEALVLLYLQNGQETLAKSLLRECAAASVSCDWAWAALSRVEILDGKISEAASHLQQAIRGRPTSWSYWSDLGWCYHAEGKQAAALKAFGRAEELLEQHAMDSGGGGSIGSHEMVQLRARVRIKTQLGTIRRQIGQVDEAVESFSEALNLDPESGLALEGAGEAFLAQAHARASEGLYTAAAEALRRGRDVLQRFHDARTREGDNDLPCSWKVLGDLHTYAHKLPAICFEADGEGKSDMAPQSGVPLGPDTVESVASHQERTRRGSSNILAFVEQGEVAYQRVVAIFRAERELVGADSKGSERYKESSEQLASALYDLGLNYLLRSRLIRAQFGEGSGLWEQDVYDSLAEVSELMRFAEQAFKQAIEANPLFAEAWNGLGMVSTYPLIRQHCWVRSVQLAHNPSAWANLGMLYLRWGLDVQAYESFGGLQAVTDHPNMWVGLGLLKESEACLPNVTSAKRGRLLSQASDAYYSSLETEQHVGGLLGLGTTAASSHSQADALIALEQYVDLNSNSAQAWNQLGALAEFTGRMSKAVAAYRRALVILEEQGATLAGGLGASTEGSKKGDEDEVTHTHPRWADAVDVVTRNLARALARQGQAEEAVRVHENLDPGESPLILARAHGLRADWDTALAILEEVQDPGEVMGGLLSGIAARYRSGDKVGSAEASASLMARYPKDRRVVLMAISLGALIRDRERTQEALRQLEALPVSVKASDRNGRAGRAAAEDGLWTSFLALRATGASNAESRRALCKSVHLSPSSVKSWARLGTVLADDAVLRHQARISGLASSSHTEPSGIDESADLAMTCLKAAEKQALFNLMGTGRDLQVRSSGMRSSEGANDINASMTVDLSAYEYARILTGIAKAQLCGGKPGSSLRAAKAVARAVHTYPGIGEAWDFLSVALVGHSLSSDLDDEETRAFLAAAHRIYARIGTADWSPENCAGHPTSLTTMEAEYCGSILTGDGKSVGDDADSAGGRDGERAQDGAANKPTDTGDGRATFPAKLMAARRSLRRAVPGTVDRYKDALRTNPDSLVAWRELAEYYELSGSVQASLAALKCGSQVPRAINGKPSASAAPLLLKMATTKLSTGQEEQGLRLITEAFRCGKGGAVGHALRAVINTRTGNERLAARSFESAREIDPDVAKHLNGLVSFEGKGSAPEL